MAKIEAARKAFMLAHIDEIGLKEGTATFLKSEGVWTLGQLLSIPVPVYKTMTGMGVDRVSDIDSALERFNLKRGELGSYYGRFFNYAGTPSTNSVDYARASFRRASELVIFALEAQESPVSSKESMTEQDLRLIPY